MKKTIKVTLENTETNEDYMNLRMEMIEELVHIEMSAPAPKMLSHYEEMLTEMFTFMTDEDLATVIISEEEWLFGNKVWHGTI